MKTLHFIVNPKSKNGYGLVIWEAIKAELELRKIVHKSYFTQYPGHASEIAESIAKENSTETVVVAVGGDGTIHEIINGIIHYSNVKLGIIPCGSGNDFARGYRIPNEPLLALTQIIEQEQQAPEYIDIGKITINDDKEIFFANNMGAGFDAEVASGANKSRLKAIFNKFSLGGLVYGLILIKKLFSFQCSSIDVNIDGRRYCFPGTWFITVANQPYYGGGMIIAPEANAADGELNIVVVNQLAKFKLLAVFISVFWGGHVKFKEVTLLTGKRISISSSHVFLVHADGEICGNAPLQLEVIPKALPIIAMSEQAMKE